MNACTLNLRHTADASRIDAAVRACVAGLLSCRALRAFLGSGSVSIERLGQDRYGRTLARIYVGGRDAGDYLIRRGLARPWR